MSMVGGTISIDNYLNNIDTDRKELKKTLDRYTKGKNLMIENQDQFRKYIQKPL